MTTVVALTEHEFRPRQKLPDETAHILATRFAREMEVIPSFEPGCYDLRARQFVGVIRGPGLALHIAPKVPVTNLFAMLSLAYDLADLHPELSTFGRVEGLFEFLVDLFANRASDLLHRGLRRAAVETQENLSLVRGQIRFPENLRQNQATRHRHVCRYVELSPNLPENQILYLAGERLAEYSYADDRLAGRLRRLARSLQQLGVTLPVPGTGTPEVIFHRLNDQYRPAVHLARMLLDMAGPQPGPGEQTFFSFLLDMNRLFEHYVARLLARDLPPTGLGVDLQPHLVLDQGGDVPIRPDIVIRSGGHPYLVVDTKYKRLADGQVEPDDLFQILAYCRALGLDRAVLIYPAAGAKERIIHIRDGTAIVEMLFMALDGSLAELRMEEYRLAAEVAGGKMLRMHSAL